jgi:hypothetical protein
VDKALFYAGTRGFQAETITRLRLSWGSRTSLAAVQSEEWNYLGFATISDKRFCRPAAAPLVRFAGTAGPGSFRSTTGAKVAADATNVHTSPMTLKGAALLALIGTILMTVLLAWTFVLTFLNALRGLVPAVTLFQSFIYAFGRFSVMLFFFVFHRAQ